MKERRKDEIKGKREEGGKDGSSGRKINLSWVQYIVGYCILTTSRLMGHAVDIDHPSQLIYPMKARQVLYMRGICNNKCMYLGSIANTSLGIFPHDNTHSHVYKQPLSNQCSLHHQHEYI